MIVPFHKAFKSRLNKTETNVVLKSDTIHHSGKEPIGQYADLRFRGFELY